jgi:hypothetical protein
LDRTSSVGALEVVRAGACGLANLSIGTSESNTVVRSNKLEASLARAPRRGLSSDLARRAAGLEGDVNGAGGAGRVPFSFLNKGARAAARTGRGVILEEVAVQSTAKLDGVDGSTSASVRTFQVTTALGNDCRSEESEGQDDAALHGRRKSGLK